MRELLAVMGATIIAFLWCVAWIAGAAIIVGVFTLPIEVAIPLGALSGVTGGLSSLPVWLISRGLIAGDL